MDNDVYKDFMQFDAAGPHWLTATASRCQT